MIFRVRWEDKGKRGRGFNVLERRASALIKRRKRCQENPDRSESMNENRMNGRCNRLQESGCQVTIKKNALAAIPDYISITTRV